MNQYDLPGSLMAETLRLLKADSRDLKQIHEETQLPFYWLRDFAGGRFSNPSCNRVQYLYEQLSKKPLAI